MVPAGLKVAAPDLGDLAVSPWWQAEVPPPCTLQPPSLGQNFAGSFISGCLWRGERRTVPMGSCPTCPRVFCFWERGQQAVDPAPTPAAGEGSSACMGLGLLPAMGPLTGTLFCLQPCGYGLYPGDTFSSATQKEGTWSTRSSRGRLLGMGFQPLSVHFLVDKTKPPGPGGTQR